MVRSQPEVTVSQIVEPLKKAVKTQKNCLDDKMTNFGKNNFQRNLFLKLFISLKLLNTAANSFCWKTEFSQICCGKMTLIPGTILV